MSLGQLVVYIGIDSINFTQLALSQWPGIVSRNTVTEQKEAAQNIESENGVQPRVIKVSSDIAVTFGIPKGFFKI